MVKECAASNLKLFMKMHNHSSQEMARAGGVSRQSIADYKKGKMLPSFTVLQNWHKALGLNVNWLMTGEGEMLLEEGGVSPDFEHLREVLKERERHISSLLRENENLLENNKSLRKNNDHLLDEIQQRAGGKAAEGDRGEEFRLREEPGRYGGPGTGRLQENPDDYKA